MLVVDQPTVGSVLLRLDFSFPADYWAPRVFKDTEEFYDYMAKHIEYFAKAWLAPGNHSFDRIYVEPDTLEFSSGGYETEGSN